MFTTSLILIILFFLWKYLKEYIIYFKTGDPKENTSTYWMFSYDFKSDKKEDFKPDSLKIIKKRRFVNSLVLLLYIDILLIFLFLNSWISQLLILLTGNQIDNNF
ncbi:MAG: hypothetical protein VXV90_00745 [Pseudomonadota bacterium]|nr:hypothetical protein [Pseudomonadota bacterium]